MENGEFFRGNLDQAKAYLQELGAREPNKHFIEVFVQKVPDEPGKYETKYPHERMVEIFENREFDKIIEKENAHILQKLRPNQ